MGDDAVVVTLGRPSTTIPDDPKEYFATDTNIGMEGKSFSRTTRE
jgi:hypothetical protein